jgi:hypothetical protein
MVLISSAYALAFALSFRFYMSFCFPSFASRRSHCLVASIDPSRSVKLGPMHSIGPMASAFNLLECHSVSL